MIDNKPDSRWMQRCILAAVCVLVIGIYAFTAHSGVLESLDHDPSHTFYNLLVQGFRAGQISLKIEAPPGLAQFADPYVPTAPVHYALHDMSYYKGKLYLYFGVTPALILFWPYVALTGHYLFDRQAVLVFCSIGFVASVLLVHTLWRRYFAEVSVGVVAACALALGLATFVPVMLQRCAVNAVAVSCGYMLTILALGAILCALHEPERRCRWLAAASLLYGIAVGARPSLLFGAIILLLPVAKAWRDRERIWAPLIAATGPTIFIGVGLMAYNDLRFDNPFELGMRYQLATLQPKEFLSLRHLWFNFRVYFLEPARWGGHFPFVREIAVPPLPAGYGLVETPFGVLTNIPLVWFALAVPLALQRGRPSEADSILCWFVTIIALLFGTCASTIVLFGAAVIRYQVDFLPTLVLLAAVGILGLERALAERPLWRRTVRWGWGLLLAYSVAFNLLASVNYFAETKHRVAVALWRTGRPQEAIQHLEQVLRIYPNYAPVHYDLGVVLAKSGRAEDAIKHYEQGLRIKPDSAIAHNSLWNALIQIGNVEDAIMQLEVAVQLKPDLAEAHGNLGNALLQAGRVPEAVGHLERAVLLKPDYADAHYTLAVALSGQGKAAEAVEHYEKVLQLMPGFADTYNNLAWILATDSDERVRDPARAVQHAERACELTKRRDPETLDTLAAAQAAAGRFDDAIHTAEEAITVALAAGQKDLAKEIESHLEFYKAGQPFRKKPVATPNP